MKRLITTLSLSLFVAALVAGPARAQEPADGLDGAPASVEDESEQVRERVRLYLQRHGDNGVIDPEQRRKGLTAVHVEMTARKRPGAQRVLAGPTWVSLGPTNGAGRMTALAPHPTVAGTVYAGSAGGGVWKTVDGGVTWTPLTETISDLSVGAVALAPSAPNVVYVGTGEGGTGLDFIPGIGLLRSTDGGSSWALPSSVVAPMFYRISVHPANPNELLAGTNRGLLRSTDGGTSFATTLDPSAGDAVELLRHPANPSVVWAGLWCKTACTPSSALVRKSTDGGVSWSPSSTGLPSPGAMLQPYPTRPAIAVSRSNPQILYLTAAITDQASGAQLSHVYKSVDGAATWTELTGISGNPDMTFRMFHQYQGWYDNVIGVSPSDPGVVFAGGVYYVRTTDGGTTWTLPADRPHADVHDICYQGSTLWIANDGGIWTSLDGGNHFTDRNTGLVTYQYYTVANDPVNPLRVLGGTQDNGTNQRTASGTTWRGILGGDGLECAVNPAVPEVAYGTVFSTLLYRTKNAGGDSPFFDFIGPWIPADEVSSFYSLVTMDPEVPSTLYTASVYRVWRSTDGGDSWLPLSTTMADGSAWYGTRTYRGVWISSIARSRANPSLLMISWSSSGKVLKSTDGGSTWRNASSGLPASAVNKLEIDQANPDLVFAAIATQSGNSVYRSTDGGTSWQPRASGLPLFAAQVVRIDPRDSTVVYCGTDVGVYQSTDQGGSWTRFGAGLPAVSVDDLRITEDGSIFRVATHGRGIWELQTQTSNNPPTAVITSPTGSLTVPKGTTVTFAGTLGDPDAGDTVSGSWNVTDGWTSFPVHSGPSSLTHTFSRSGTFPVSLAARDSYGARAASVVMVTVREQADSCATPIVIPPSGPFPYTVSASNEGATVEPTDPVASCYPYGFVRSLWFEFTPGESGTYEISTCGATFYSVLSVWTGSVCGPYLPVAGGCNIYGSSGPCPTMSPGYTPSASFVSIPLSAGQTVRIQVQSPNAHFHGTVPFTVSRAASSSAPRVSSVSPHSGPAAGGTAVSVTGMNFSPGATVAFGGSSVPATVVNPMILSATTPTHTAGLVDVSVRNPDASTGTGSAAFTYGAVPADGATCVPDASTLCLLGNRFAVRANWADYQGRKGAGTAVSLTPDTGYFWFFDAKNVEAVVKMVSFCGGGSDNVGIYAGGLTDLDVTLHVTDMRTGLTKDYVNPLGTLFRLIREGPFECLAGVTEGLPPGFDPGFGPAGSSDVGRVTNGGAPPSTSTTALPEPLSACTADSTTLCLLDGRFQIRSTYRNYEGRTGTGQAVPLTPDTGTFWFFDANNIELVAKMVSFCGSGSNNVGIYAGGLTDLEVALTVTDTQTGLVKTYPNALGTPFQLIRDGPFSCP